MNAADALRDIKGYAEAGRVTYTKHGRERMAQRNVTDGDVERALVNAVTCVAADHGNWKTTGPDLDGDALDVVVALEGEDVVITVF